MAGGPELGAKSIYERGAPLFGPGILLQDRTAGGSRHQSARICCDTPAATSSRMTESTHDPCKPSWGIATF